MYKTCISLELLHNHILAGSAANTRHVSFKLQIIWQTRKFMASVKLQIIWQTRKFMAKLVQQFHVT